MVIRGINFDVDIDTPICEIQYLHNITLIYNNYTVKLYNIYYDNDDDFAIFVTDTELHIDSPVVSYDFVFSFDGCKLYKLTDTIFICKSSLWRGESNKNPIELFNKYMTHIN